MNTRWIGRTAATFVIPIVVAATPGAAVADPPSGTSLAVVSSVDRATDWIAGELDANAHAIPSSFPGATDWGLTADTILALAAAGKGHHASAEAAMDNLMDNALSYVTDADFGAGNERYAGALGKLILVAKIEGKDIGSVGGLDLEAELRDRLTATGPQTGRFVDLSTFGDFSNGLGQAFDVLALARTSGGVPAPAVTFLIAQQCPGGGFRIAYTTGDTCTADSSADPDATGLAIEALLSVPTSPVVTAAVAKGVVWLTTIQRPDGSFNGGPSNTPNANTTGLVGAALRAAGKGAAANSAAAWISSLQLTSPNVGTGPAAAELGAVAYDPAARDAAIAGGVLTTARDQFRRATAQAILALGVPAYNQIGTVQPVDPAPVAALSNPALTGGSSVTVTAGGFTPGEIVKITLFSDPVGLGSATANGPGR